MNEKKPKISVIMGIYNCASTLSESIDSILRQTYTNWELIMCDDGSEDHTYKIAKQYSDQYKNIKLIRNQDNRGLAYTLNQCLQYVDGEYIARQDGDDRSKPERFEKQVEILDKYPEYSFVSSGMTMFDENGDWGEVTPIEKPGKFDFIKGSPFCHAPSMMRKEALIRIGGYIDTNKTLRVEDYDLWFRMYSKGFRGYNIREALYEVRDDRDAISRRKFKYRINEAYVRFNGYRMLKLPLKSYMYALKPILVGLLPIMLYKYYRKILYVKSPS